MEKNNTQKNSWRSTFGRMEKVIFAPKKKQRRRQNERNTKHIDWRGIHIYMIYHKLCLSTAQPPHHRHQIILHHKRLVCRRRRHRHYHRHRCRYHCRQRFHFISLVHTHLLRCFCLSCCPFFLSIYFFS